MRYGLQQHLWRRRRGWGLSLWLQRFTPRRVQWQALGREVVQRRQWLLVVCFYCGGRPQLPGRHATGVHQGVPQHPAPGVPGVRRGVQDGVRSAGSEFLRSAGERQRLGEGQRMLEHHVHQSATSLFASESRRIARGVLFVVLSPPFELGSWASPVADSDSYRPGTAYCLPILVSSRLALHLRSYVEAQSSSEITWNNSRRTK